MLLPVVVIVPVELIAPLEIVPILTKFLDEFMTVVPPSFIAPITFVELLVNVEFGVTWNTTSSFELRT